MSSYQISSKSLEPRPRYRDFSISLRWRPTAVRHLGLVVRVLRPPKGHLVVFITVQNLVEIDAVVLIICTFFNFASLA